MERMSLPPGFRFHPTDAELVMYYLKRKVLGKKHFKAIAEVNIYKFSPWDLPDKSCLKSKDLEWFFFCPREKKYASGFRVKRDTENGYWKTTGKDRRIYSDNRPVGTVKTLVFHLGKPPKGVRTDWVIHEYRIVDDQLATAGVQDTYVLCKVFKKDGLGPKNGAQYGAPFDEADWADDDDDVQNLVISISNNELDMVSAPPEIQSSGLTGMVDSGSNTSLNVAGPSYTAGHPLTNEMGDEIYHLLDSFGDDDTLPLNDNGNQDDYTLPLNDNGNQDDYTLPLNDNGNHEDDFSGNYFDGNGIYNGLDDLERWAFMNEEGMFGSGMQIDEYTLNGMLPEDNQFYIELNDLTAPLNCFHGATEHITAGDIFGPYSHGNMAEDLLPDRAHYESPINQLPGLSRQSNREGGCSDMLEMVDPQDMEREI